MKPALKSNQTYPFSLRWEAFSVDLKIILVFVTAVMLLSLNSGEPENMQTSSVHRFSGLVLFLILVKDILGNSYGKSIQRLVIIDRKTGKMAAAWQCALRNLTVLIFPIELVIVLITMNLRIGDWLAGTTVVKNEGDIDTTLTRSRLLQSLVIAAIISAGLFCSWSYRQREVHKEMDASFNQPLSQHLDTVLMQSLNQVVIRTITRIYEPGGVNAEKTVNLFVEVKYSQYACTDHDWENTDFERLYEEIIKILDETMQATGYGGQIRFYYNAGRGGHCSTTRNIID